ncbi:MAG: GspB domain-containing protein [Methylococcales bacterium]|jgi:general secretion pathway protein B|nr:GspB domain-containing protein [Methylococcales bacterium]MBT7443591.1 GspB domain-containing protein [Methylococcales bacterium]
MSYILDALRKSEQDRAQSHSREVGSGGGVIPAAKEKGGWWNKLLILVIVGNIIGFVYVVYDNGMLAQWLEKSQPQDQVVIKAPRQEVIVNNNAAVEYVLEPTAPVVAVKPQSVPQNKLRDIVPITPKVVPRQVPKLPLAEEPVALGKEFEVVASEPVVSDELGFTPTEEVVPQPEPTESFVLTAPAEPESTKLDSVKAAIATVKRVQPESPTPPSDAEANGLPRYDELSLKLRRGLPSLEITIHIYSNTPASRKVYINGQKQIVGEAADKGYIVEKILYSGVIIEYKGTRFFLPK